MQGTQQSQPDHSRLHSRIWPAGTPTDHTRASQNGHSRQHGASEFDLVVTFGIDAQARDALLSLRHAGFGPDQAVLLSRGPLGQDELQLAEQELRSESWIAFGIVVATELLIGILLGSVIGWLIGLFRNEPDVGAIWQPIFMCGIIGFVLALVVSVVEWRRWRRVHLPASGAAAVALRLRGPSAPRQLGLAQSVLEQFGGQSETR